MRGGGSLGNFNFQAKVYHTPCQQASGNSLIVVHKHSPLWRGGILRSKMTGWFGKRTRPPRRCAAPLRRRGIAQPPDGRLNTLYFLHRRATASPAKPSPNTVSVAGSGTVDVVFGSQYAYTMSSYARDVQTFSQLP